MRESKELKTEKFSVQVVESPVSGAVAPSAGCVFGRITVNDFSEIFEMSLSYWSVDQYMQSWRHAMNMLDRSEDATSCLITSITDPLNSNFIVCWPMYREGDDVYVRNRLLFLMDLDEKFDEKNPWRHMDPRAVEDEDGRRISEWHTGIAQVREFVRLGWG